MYDSSLYTPVLALRFCLVDLFYIVYFHCHSANRNTINTTHVFTSYSWVGSVTTHVLYFALQVS